ncbi:hypothetical protein ACMBCN_01670 [Candidatus Liberibacter asiaticus]
MDVWGIITENPHDTTTRPLGKPRGLKGLLHMLNVTMTIHESDLG